MRELNRHERRMQAAIARRSSGISQAGAFGTRKEFSMLEKIYQKAEEDWKKARIAILQFFAQAMQQGQQILSNTMQQIEGIVHRDLEKIVGLEDDLKRDLEAVHAAYEDAAAKSAAFLTKVQAALAPKVETAPDAPAGTVIDASDRFGTTAPADTPEATS